MNRGASAFQAVLFYLLDITLQGRGAKHFFTSGSGLLNSYPVQGCFFHTKWCGNRNLSSYFHTTWRRLVWKSAVFSTPHSGPWCGNQGKFPHHLVWNSPPQAKNLRILVPKHLIFLKKLIYSNPWNPKKIGLRRAGKTPWNDIFAKNLNYFHPTWRTLGWK